MPASSPRKRPLHSDNPWFRDPTHKIRKTSVDDDTIEDGEIPEQIDRYSRPSHSLKLDYGRPHDSDREPCRDHQRSTHRSRERSPSRNRIQERHRDRERDYTQEARCDRERRKQRTPPHSDRKRSPDRDRPRRRFDDEVRSSQYRRPDHHRRDSEGHARIKTNGSLDSSQHDNGLAQHDDDDEVQGVAETKPQLTEDEILEQARRKRAEILAKHKQLNQTINPSDLFTMTTDPRVPVPPPPSAPANPPSSTAIDTLPLKSNHVSILRDLPSNENSPAGRVRHDSQTPLPTRGGSEQGSDSVPASPHELVAETNFDLTQDANNKIALAATGEDDSITAKHPLDHQNITGVGHQSISAADYNPDNDRRIDNERQHEKQVERGGPNGIGEVQNDDNNQVDDDDDMFAIDSSEKNKTKVSKVVQTKETSNPFLPVINRAATDVEVVDNFDDADGYYRVILGELLDNGRYHVHANLGKGMFASVVRAKDVSIIKEGQAGSGRDVAIKVVRSQESMFKSSQKEASILKKLQEADPAGKYHIIRLERTFEHRGHFCLVFEAMSMNLREIVKRFGKDIGINLRAVRAYAHQMFLALSLLKKCNIMHADLKPDNILVNETKSVLKVCDLGSASDITENEITPYLVSRFYRAPEIILGLPYDCSIDIWSIGCTLYELYTGKILFPGRSNNHLLLLIMELKGRFNSKLLKKAKFSGVHFDEENGNFLSIEKNRITGADIVKSINIPNKPSQGLQSRLMPNHVTKKMQDADVRLLSAFVDLLEKILTLEPSKRITPKEALNHPFIRGI